MPENRTIDSVAVVGLGTLGVQIALQAAAMGYDVRGYDPDPDAFGRMFEKFSHLISGDASPGPVDLGKWKHAAGRVALSESFSSAVQRADLIIEVVPEDLEVKKKVWSEMDAHCSSGAILASNSSSMPVSRLENVTRRPEKCLNLHFYQLILGQNMADVMGGTRTSPETMEAGIEFVKSLNVIPLRVNKESLGFCYNRVWRAIKKEVLQMWAEDVVDFRDVDRAFMVFAKTPWGPFGLMDTVGLDVIWDIEMVYFRESQKPEDHPPQALKDLIEAGHLGVKSGQGFYTYPTPEFAGPDFLNPNRSSRSDDCSE
ncbi:MAG: 3-hydroxyacyl-CoA dehydrogenase family protein [Deltaproteobacteria bacterium]|nr:3-hydroxyacyl-CoA dehydrogenase family protein [Deltaproteobacteria bacterium]